MSGVFGGSLLLIRIRFEACVVLSEIIDEITVASFIRHGTYMNKKHHGLDMSVYFIEAKVRDE